MRSPTRVWLFLLVLATGCGRFGYELLEGDGGGAVTSDGGRPDGGASGDGGGTPGTDGGGPVSDGGAVSPDGGSTTDGGGGAADAGLPLDGGGDGVEDPPAGNPLAPAAVPAEAAAVDTSSPDTVIGTGTAASCTSAAVIAGIAGGGVITFDCGPDPVTIVLDEPARIFNDTGPEIVIDGGGRVTLSGGGSHRILYMNTCDPDLVWTTPTCNDQDHPRVTLQNLTFVDGDSRADATRTGGGAIWARGGRLKIVNSRFFRNRTVETGMDVGGGALHVTDQFSDLPVYVVGSTFGGAEGYGNAGSEGGAIHSVGTSWTLINCVLTHNVATGSGARVTAPFGGAGGAIYNDGNTMTLDLRGTIIKHNQAPEHGSAILFVTNDRTGNMVIDQSTITLNTGGSWYPIYPQISCHPDTMITVTASTIE